jgi:hypothetical protein
MLQNGNPMHKAPHHRFKNKCEDSVSFDSLSNLVFCCYNQRNPQFFILLAEMLVSECLYLAFRVFILTKVDFEKLLTAKPLIVFFMIKNFLFILNQMYRVYSKSNKHKKLKMVEKYKSFLLANGNRTLANPSQQRQESNFQNRNMLAEYHNQQQQQQQLMHHYNPKYNMGEFSFAPAMAKNAFLAAAAAGGQIPLGQANQAQFYFNEDIAPNQNPYRFAQVYNDQPQIFSAQRPGSGLTTPNHGPVNKPADQRRLSSASAAYINDHSNNSSNAYAHYAQNQGHVYGNNNNSNSTGSHNNSNNNNGSNSTNKGNMGSAHASDFQQHRASLSTLLSESLLEMMDKENDMLAQQTGQSTHQAAAANLALSQQKALRLSVQNNCVSKPGSRFYGLPIKSGGGEAPLNSTSTASLLKNSSAANLSSASVIGKHFRGAKI